MIFPRSSSVFSISQQRAPLHRILARVGRSIDDVVNDPIARNQVRYYFRVQKFVARRSETLELEQQWNPLGIRD